METDAGILTGPLGPRGQREPFSIVVSLGVPDCIVRAAEVFCDVVYPRHCICCGGAARPIEGRDVGLRFFCKLCETTLECVRTPHCPRCGVPYYGAVSGDRMCPNCCALCPVFQSGRALLRSQGSARALIHELKYRGGRYLLTDIRRLLRRSPAYLDFLRGALLVPVPLYACRLRERGYNQSLLIAECMAAESQGARVAQVLKRRVDTRSQTELNRVQRRRNVRDAFGLSGKGVVIDARFRYVVVDDVVTTGATLNACCRVLGKAGASQIDVATLGHG